MPNPELPLPRIVADVTPKFIIICFAQSNAHNSFQDFLPLSTTHLHLCFASHSCTIPRLTHYNNYSFNAIHIVNPHQFESDSLRSHLFCVVRRFFLWLQTSFYGRSDPRAFISRTKVKSVKQNVFTSIYVYILRNPFARKQCHQRKRRPADEVKSSAVFSNSFALIKSSIRLRLTGNDPFFGRTFADNWNQELPEHHNLNAQSSLINSWFK